MIPEDERVEAPPEVRALRATARDERLALRAAEAVLAGVQEATERDVAAAAEARLQMERRAAAAERRLAQNVAAGAAGLDHSLADRLAGSTPEELLADAKRLRKLT